MTKEKRGVARAADHLYYASVVLIWLLFCTFQIVQYSLSDMTPVSCNVLIVYNLLVEFDLKLM